MTLSGVSELMLSEIPTARPLLLRAIHQILLAQRLLATYPMHTGSLKMETDPCTLYLSAPLARVRALLLDAGAAESSSCTKHWKSLRARFR